MFLLPTRSRPKNLRRFLEAYKACCSTASVYLIFDEDDPCLDEYQQIETPLNWHESVMPSSNQGILEKVNYIFRAIDNRPWYGLLGDDNVPVTFEWDKRLIETAGNDGVAWPNDGIRKGDFGTLLVIGGDLVREMGWLAPPGMKHLYVDTLWTEIGRSRGKAYYLEDTWVPHYHFSNGKAPMDDTYQRHAGFAENDRKIYESVIGKIHAR